MRVQIEHLGIDQEVKDYKLIKELEGNKVSKKIESNVKFVGVDYENLRNETLRGKGVDNCTLKFLCGEDEINIQGNIQHNEGDFSMKSCTFLKKISLKDVTTCFKDREVNIFDYSSKAINTIQGEKEERFHVYSKNLVFNEDEKPQLDFLINELNGIPDYSVDGWIITFIKVTANPNPSSPIYDGYIYGTYINTVCTLNITYTRIKSNTQINSDWLPIPSLPGFFYFKDIKTPEWLSPEYKVYLYKYNSVFIYQYFGAVYQKGRSDSILDDQISNSIDFNEIIEDIFSCTGFELVSNFFGINADSTQPQNEVYEYAVSNLNKLKIVQAYDVIREEAIQDSFGVSGKMKAKRFLNDIITLFNLIYIPDTETNKLRLEHASYFQVNGIDFTTNGKSYSLDDLFKVNKDLITSEVWRMAVLTPLGYETTITYDVLDEGQKNEYQIETLVTDVVSLINNPEYEKDEFKKLFFLIQTDGDSIIGLNKGLHIDEVVKKFHYSNRPLPKGKHDGLDVSFSGYSLGITNKLDYQGSIKDFIKFNPANSVKLNEGTFMITKIEFINNLKIQISIKK